MSVSSVLWAGCALAAGDRAIVAADQFPSSFHSVESVIPPPVPRSTLLVLSQNSARETGLSVPWDAVPFRVRRESHICDPLQTECDTTAPAVGLQHPYCDR
jgi:hypothetical protein